MTQSVDIYKGTEKVGSGTATAASASITSFTNTSGNYGKFANANATGKSYNSRVVSGGSTVVLKDAHPFSD